MPRFFGNLSFAAAPLRSAWTAIAFRARTEGTGACVASGRPRRGWPAGRDRTARRAASGEELAAFERIELGEETVLGVAIHGWHF